MTAPNRVFTSNWSIGKRLTVFTGLFMFLVVSVAVLATSRMLVIDQRTQELESRWLTSTHLLNELRGRLSDFRLSETYRDPNPNRLGDDEVVSNLHRKVINELEAQYAQVMGPASASDLAAFHAAWKAYTSEHDAWVAADANGRSAEAAQHSSALHQLYQTANALVDKLIEGNRTAAAVEHQAVGNVLDQTVAELLSASLLAILLGAGGLLWIWGKLVRPLSAITEALSRLANGDRDVALPELDRRDEIGKMATAFEVFRRDAEALEAAHAATQAAQEQAQALARHDALTGLPNRRVFTAELETALSHAATGASIASVLIMDLDRFKPVNDLHGHAVGDLVLCEIARRLQNSVRKTDTVARLGGDEFAIIGESSPGAYPDEIIHLTARLVAAIREPIIIGEMRIEVGASVGIASAPIDGVDAETLIRGADIAMYRAKHEGSGSFHFFERSMDDELRVQAALETDLRRAIAEGAIVPHYQPLVDMHDQRVYGFEVLARWHDPKRGWVGPDVFIPIAEQLGLVSDLTASMLRRACREAADWDKSIEISVNLSPLQLKDPALPTKILTILNQENFPPSRLEIEITEAALIADLEMARQILTSLQAVGIKVALDDFGTGYSSLYHLRQLKFDKLKIDRSFVLSLEQGGESEMIVDAILGLARSIGLPTVAEGIESSAILQRIADKGCEFGQGFYFGKAMNADSVAELLGTQAGLQRAG